MACREGYVAIDPQGLSSAPQELDNWRQGFDTPRPKPGQTIRSTWLAQLLEAIICCSS